MKPCATIGCVGRAVDHAYCPPCRYMRKRARAAGIAPDARTWRQLNAKFWNQREKAHVAR
jgi:hypothetical protein